MTTPHEIEEWRDIPSWPNHQASSLGRIQSVDHIAIRIVAGKTVRQPRRGKLLRLFEHTAGKEYLGVGPGLKVHVLVLEAFKGPCPPGEEGRHLNDIKTDNRIENLEWGTRSDNILDRTLNGNPPGVNLVVPDREERAAMRSWARQNGHRIAVTGVIPRHIQEAYRDQH